MYVPTYVTVYIHTYMLNSRGVHRCIYSYISTYCDD